MKQIFLILLLNATFFVAEAQNIFSQTELDFRKPFAPYDVQNVVGLDDQEMVILMEEGKGRFRLVRYDKYFFDKWNVSLDFKKEGSFPKLFLYNGSIIIFRFWTIKGSAFGEVYVYNVENGALLSHEKKALVEKATDISNISVSFAENRHQFLVYNYATDDEQTEFDLYELSSLEKRKSYAIAKTETQNKIPAVFVNGNDDLFVVLADPAAYTLDTYYFSDKTLEPVTLSSAFSFKRPLDNIPTLKILKQSESTYMVTTPVYVESELIGMNISSFNVVLKSILFSNSYDFDSEFIKDAYSQSIFTSENQRKKNILTPQNLDNFRLQQVIPDSEGGATCIFENLELPSSYHSSGLEVNKPLKWKTPDDVYFFGEDLLFVGCSSTGNISWKKVIQKTQYGHNNGLTLSYFSEVYGDELKIVMQEDARGNSIFTYTVDLLNGGIADTRSFIDKKIQINKNYSTWINENTMLLCGYQDGSKKRSLYLVEF